MTNRSSITLRFRKILHGGRSLKMGLIVVGIAVVIVATSAAVGSAIAQLIETL